MADQFGPHDRKHGGRLEQIQALGRRGGLAGQFRDIPGEGAEAGSAGAPRRLQADPGRDVPAEAFRLAGRDGVAFVRGDRVISRSEAEKPARVLTASTQPKRPPGRPKVEGERPWEALKISRASYFRRKAEGTL